MRENGEKRCSVCERPAVSKGLCSRHYARLLKHGSPLVNDHPGTDGWTLEALMARVKVARRPHPVLGTPCWLWQGTIHKHTGYGRAGRESAHRRMYQAMVGPLPKRPSRVELDHLCRVRACVNPKHLQKVTSKVNTLRGQGPTALNAKKTHCKRGHPFDAKNTYRHPGSNRRACRTCARERQKQQKAQT